MVSTHAWFRFTLKFTFIVQLSVLHSLASPAEWLPMFPKLRYFSYTAGMLQCWAPPLSCTMTSLKRSQTERSVGGSVPATDEFYTRRLRLPNGGAPPPRSESTHLTGTPGVPKMGVRARVADWPPRKDGGSGGSGGGGGNGGGVWHITVETDSPSTTTGSAQSNLSSKLGHLISPQDSSMLRNIHNTLKNKMHSKGKDNRFLSPDGYLGSPRKGMRRIRQRSNSDITISELDGDGSEGWSFSGWTPMHREYGSTSSIDKHGVSGESFFDMLKGYQTDAPDQRSPAPEKLSELLTVAHKQTALDLPDGPLGPPRGSPASRLKEREKHMKRRSKSETGGESIFRKLRSVKAEGDSSRAGSDAEDGKSDDVGPPPKPWVCQKGFAHLDVQSILFDLNEAVQSRQSAVKRKNTTTGASAAAAGLGLQHVLSLVHPKRGLRLPLWQPGRAQHQGRAFSRLRWWQEQRFGPQLPMFPERNWWWRREEHQPFQTGQYRQWCL